MKKSFAIIIGGIIVLFSGIILEINVRLFAGSILEFRGLEATIIVIILIAGSLITIGVAIMYELITRKYKIRNS